MKSLHDWIVLLAIGSDRFCEVGGLAPYTSATHVCLAKATVTVATHYKRRPLLSTVYIVSIYSNVFKNYFMLINC